VQYIVYEANHYFCGAVTYLTFPVECFIVCDRKMNNDMFACAHLLRLELDFRE